jgi:acyl-coenzyme A synthetase/AMP-(fatty) acid ligase/acyl carrier protein
VAYVIFTSGSTGKPKGVCVPHRAVNRLVVNCDYVKLGAEDVVAQISNCCFDAATFEIWGALLNGSRLVGIEREDVLSAERFSAELSKHGVTTLFVTTALFNELVHERGDIFRQVRNVLFGGEECDAGAVRRVLEGGPPQRLLHMYGPTETTTFATWYQIRAEQSCEGRIPIGRPITNTQVYILDDHLDAVPIGVAGEIWIGGDGVASGYLNRPELTAERFIPSPFVSGQKLYLTGDRGRFLPDGNVEFLGRRDEQVKIRGFRIELREIECVLREHPSVAAAVVVVREEEGDKQVVAYVVLALLGSAPQEAEWREFLRKKLPDYMVPSAFVVLEKLPLTPNGKVDQKALPVPAPNPRRTGFVAPSNETEKTVAEVWSAVLNVQEVGVLDNFFQLGGHSLLATRVVSRLRSIFGLDIPVRMLFEHATVGATAEFIDGVRWAATGEIPALTQREELLL